MMHNSVGVVWHTAPAEGIWKVITAINPEFFRRRGLQQPVMTVPASLQTHTHLNTYYRLPLKKNNRACFTGLNSIAQAQSSKRATVLKLSINYVDRLPLSLDDGVEIRRLLSPPLMFILGTHYRTAVCSGLHFVPSCQPLSSNSVMSISELLNHMYRLLHKLKLSQPSSHISFITVYVLCLIY